MYKKLLYGVFVFLFFAGSGIVYADVLNGGVNNLLIKLSGTTIVPAKSTWTFGSGSISAAGASSTVQYNKNGVLGGSNNFMFTGTNVGIGTTTPQRNLWVTNAGAANQIGFEDTGASADQHYWSIGTSRGAFNIHSMTDALASTSRLTITNAGLVGIGTTTPVNLLSIAGGYYDVDGKTGGYKFDSNKFIYASSTNFATVMGIGAGTGLDATSTWTTDTAIGYQALNGTPANAAIIGGNTAVGYLAIKARTSGSNNTAIGSSALKALTTGSTNVAIGNAALSLTTGSVNDTAVGSQAMQNFTAGNGNTTIGATSLVGASGATGNFNTAIGQNALTGLSSGSRNVGIGRDAGSSITSASNNAFFGSEVASTTATGSNNIALGYDIALPVINGSNQLNIGNIIFGTGVASEGSSTPLGSIGIGTTTPSATLAVQNAASSTALLSFIVASTTNSGGAYSTTTLFAIGNTGSTTLGLFGTCNSATTALGTNSSGLIICETGVSDARLKKDFAPLPNALQVIDALNPLSYNWRDTSLDNTHDKGLQYGFKAQDVEKILPALVGTTKATYLTPDVTKTLNMAQLIPWIVAAVQQVEQQVVGILTHQSVQDAQIKALQEQVKVLQAQVNKK